MRLVEYPADMGANDVKIILKLGLSDRHIYPCDIGGRIESGGRMGCSGTVFFPCGWRSFDPSRFGTVPGYLRVEDLLKYTDWVEILDVKLKEGEKPVEDIHWAQSLLGFLPRSLVLADGTVAGYMKGTARTSIVNGHLELSNGCAANGIVRVLLTELDR